MKIGTISYDYDPPIGGLGIVVKQTRKTVLKLFPSYSFVVISPSPAADDRLHPLAAFLWKKPAGCPMFSLLLSLRLEWLIRKHRIDLLHVHAGSGGVFLLRKPSRPTVVTAHHTYLQEAETVFMRHPLKNLWKRVMSRFERRTYLYADRVVCISKDTADFLITRYGIPPEKIVVIENGVMDVPDLPEPKKDPDTILFIGRLEERKGIWVILSAMEQLKTSHPKARLRLVGKNLLGSQLDRFIEDHGLTDRITQTGYVHDPFLRRELANAAVLVVPSLLEGFGLIAAEAMLAGTCVVVSDSAGLRSIVKDGKTGLMFRSGDAIDCAKQIANALDHPGLRASLEEAAREEALKRFHFEERARDLQKIFEEIAPNQAK